MTRGTLYLICPNRVIQSTEFNGDMYGSPKDSLDLQESGHYPEVIHRLRRVFSPHDFKREINAFNKANHAYEEQLIYPFKAVCQYKKQKLLDLTKDYYLDYFSDYLFFKNISDKPVWFKSKKPKHLTKIAPGQIATFYFGELIEAL
ncbi:MAG: hypothetical protein ABH896_01865 [Candidatus Jacksonbacteria bacterium]